MEETLEEKRKLITINIVNYVMSVTAMLFLACFFAYDGDTFLFWASSMLAIFGTIQIDKFTNKLLASRYDI